MKKMLFTTACLIALSACVKEKDESIKQTEYSFRIEASVSADTKTVFNPENNSVAWENDDALSVLINDGETIAAYRFDKVADEANMFECKDFIPVENKSYTYSVLYPYCEKIIPLDPSGNNEFYVTHDSFTITKSSSSNDFTWIQMPELANTSLKQSAIGDAVHVEGPLYGYTTADGTATPSVLLKHCTHILRASITNNTGSTITVQNVTVSNDANQDLRGRYMFNVSDGSVKPYPYDEISSSISMDVENGTIAAGETGIVYIPNSGFTIPEGKNLCFTVTCGEGKSEIVKTMTADLVCAPGGIRTANLTLESDNFTKFLVSVSGRVTCEGIAVADAVISDGVEITKTDSDGYYTLRSTKNMGYVFISTPSGYIVQENGIYPMHYIKTKSANTTNANFSLLPMEDDSYRMFVMADVHLVDNNEYNDLAQFHSTFYPDIKQLISQTAGESYSISLGDMTTDLRWYHDYFFIPDYLDEFSDYPTVLYHIMGNHDNDPNATGNSEAEIDWSASFPYRNSIGPTYYSLNIGKVHYVMLDNIVALGNCEYKYLIDQTQLDWLKKDLSMVSASTPIILSMHVPAYAYSGIRNGVPTIKKRTTTDQDVQVLMDILTPFEEVHLLTGHDHRNRTLQITDNIIEHNLVSVSTISWKLNDVRLISHDGTPAGYQYYDVDGDKITWYYKAVGLETEKSQFRAYDMNAVPAEYGGGVNKIMINIFNWDPSWNVSVKESGNSLVVSQVVGQDPLYMYLRAKTTAMEDRPDDWLAAKTVHIFEAEPSGTTSEIEITVTDRFGNVYTEVMERPKTFREDMN